MSVGLRLCEYPAAPSESLLSGVEPYSDRPCDKGRLFYGIFVLAACTVAAAALLLCCVLGVEGRPRYRGHGVGLFPSRNGALSNRVGLRRRECCRSTDPRESCSSSRSRRYSWASGQSHNARIIREGASQGVLGTPAFDLAFYVIFASTAAWMCWHGRQDGERGVRVWCDLPPGVPGAGLGVGGVVCV